MDSLAKEMIFDRMPQLAVTCFFVQDRTDGRELKAKTLVIMETGDF